MKIICDLNYLLRKKSNNMKKIIGTILLTIFFLTLNCSLNRESVALSNYLMELNVKKEDYRIICIVPVDGCYTCLEPAIKYLQKSHPAYLLILTSNFEKSINRLIDSKKLPLNKIIIDSNNLAIKNQLIFMTSPSFFFLNHGKLRKKVDLSETIDTAKVFKEINTFLQE